MKMICTAIAALLAVLGFASTAHAADDGEWQTVIAFGDSITYGAGTAHPDEQSWPARIGVNRVAKSGSTLVAVRVNGEPTAIKSYHHDVLGQQPDAVIVAYGMNDLVWASTTEIMAGLRKIKHWNHARGVETYVATLTPLGTAIPFGLNAPRIELNERIRAVFGDRVLDFEAALAGDDGMLPHRFDSGDGLHPNAHAYRKLANVAKQAIR